MTCACRCGFLFLRRQRLLLIASAPPPLGLLCTLNSHCCRAALVAIVVRCTGCDRKYATRSALHDVGPCCRISSLPHRLVDDGELAVAVTDAIGALQLGVVMVRLGLARWLARWLASALGLERNDLCHISRCHDIALLIARQIFLGRQ